MTVLFCDLAGFTARSDRADPEDVRALLRPYHARLRHEIERFGDLDKFIGDGVMCVFGVPSAHEDDPERAVRCGLAILDAVEELQLPVRSRWWSACSTWAAGTRRWSWPTSSWPATATSTRPTRGSA